MDGLPHAHSWRVIDYLHDDAPWELERLVSLDHVVNSWPDWAAAGSDPLEPSYSSWLRETFAMFQSRSGRGRMSSPTPTLRLGKR
jgi:hypothetical protein